MTEAEVTVESRHLYQGRVVGLRVDRVRLPDGRLTLREVVEHGETVCIVAVDDQQRVLLVRQYRKAVEEELLEVPAGGIEPGEDILEGARRELEEETGVTAQNLVPMASFYMTPGFCTELMHAFLARGLRYGAQRPADDELIRLVRIPLAQVPLLIRSGRLKDVKTIASLLMAIHIHLPREGFPLPR